MIDPNLIALQMKVIRAARGLVKLTANDWLDVQQLIDRELDRQHRQAPIGIAAEPYRPGGNAA